MEIEIRGIMGQKQKYIHQETKNPVCVRERERGRVRERVREKEKENYIRNMFIRKQRHGACVRVGESERERERERERDQEIREKFFRNPRIRVCV